VVVNSTFTAHTTKYLLTLFT